MIIVVLGDDDMLIDTQDPSDPVLNAKQTKRGVENDIEMHIDEEGRPRFAPAKNTVSGRDSKFLSDFLVAGLTVRRKCLTVWNPEKFQSRHTV